MKTYIITVPAFELTITAANKKEALERFWFDYDTAQDDALFGEAIIKESKE